jgi:hypothetical protein
MQKKQKFALLRSIRLCPPFKGTHSLNLRSKQERKSPFAFPDKVSTVAMMMIRHTSILFLACALLALVSSASAFSSIAPPSTRLSMSTVRAATESSSSTEATTEGNDPSELVAKRITVVGDVQGGYYRACVKNEVSQ